MDTIESLRRNTDVIPQGSVFITGHLDTESVALATNRGTTAKYPAGPEVQLSTIKPHELCYINSYKRSFSLTDNVLVMSTLNGQFESTTPLTECIDSIKFVGVGNGEVSQDVKGFGTSLSIQVDGVARMKNGPLNINIGDRIIWDLPIPAVKSHNIRQLLQIRPLKPNNSISEYDNFIKIAMDTYDISNYSTDSDFPLVSGTCEVLEGLSGTVVAAIHILGMAGLLVPGAMDNLFKIFNLLVKQDVPSINEASRTTTENAQAYTAFLQTRPLDAMLIFNKLAEETGAINPHIRLGDHLSRVKRSKPSELITVQSPNGMQVSLRRFAHGVLTGTYLPFVVDKSKPDASQKRKTNGIFENIIKSVLNGIKRGETYYTRRLIGVALNATGPGQMVDVLMRRQ